MNLRLGETFEIGDGTNYIITDIDGLGKADIRTSSMLYSGRDGGKITQQFYGMRQIPVVGLIKNDTPAAHKLARVAFDEACPIGSEIPVYITLFDGSVYLINCYVADLKMPYKPFGKASTFKLELVAGDPLFYDEAAGLQEVGIELAEAGGYATPYILPVEWLPGNQPTTVTNSGNTIVYPVITLNDDLINPVIENQTTGEIMQVNITMIAGDELVIDMNNRTIKLNGGSILANKDDSSTWWGLMTGPNSITLNSDDPDDVGTATVSWRNGQTGI